jgi:uncharacterized protein YaiL (DUF2058 family)
MSSEDRFARLQERYEALSVRLLGENPEIRTSSGSNLKGGAQKKQTRPKSSLDVQTTANRSQSEHAKRLKLVHDHMWQHRQEGKMIRFEYWAILWRLSAQK